jgi:hypothetical protein
LTLAGALLALIMFIEEPWREERAREASRFVLPGLDPASITRVELTPWGQKLIEARRPAARSHDWRLTQPIAYAASAAPIEGLLKALAEVQWQDRITAAELQRRPDAGSAYGFARPQYTVKLDGANGSRHLVIGATSALGDQLFVQVVGSYDIYLVSAELTNAFPRNKDHWRDTALAVLGAPPVDGIQVRSLGRGFEAQRDPATHLWQMKKPVQARADSPKIEHWLAQLSEIHVMWFAPEDGPYELDRFGLQAPAQMPQLELSLLRDTNTVFNLVVSSNATGLAGTAFARRGDPSNVVLIPVGNLLPWEGDSTNFLDRHMFSLPLAQLDVIEAAGDDHFTVRRQADQSWQVTATNATFPADAILMSDWLGEFTNAQLDIEKMVVADLAAYGLDKPQLVYKLQGAGGGSNQLLAQIEFGATRDGRTFERRTDESAVNVMDAAEFDRLPRVSWQMRDRRIWDFAGSNVVSVAIHQLGGDRKYLRDPNGDWTFAPGFHGPPYFNAPRLEEALYRFGQLRAVYWDGMGDDPSDHFGFKAADHRVTLEVRKGDHTETLEIEFGHRSPYRHAYAAVVKNGQRLIFEFPVDFYNGFILPEFTLPAALRPH